MPTPCALTVVRRGGFADALRAYRIVVNGQQVGTVRRNCTLRLNLPIGPLTIEARIDWARSPPLQINAAPGDEIAVEVANYWGALFSLWGATFGMRSYLTLTRLPPALAAAWV